VHTPSGEHPQPGTSSYRKAVGMDKKQFTQLVRKLETLKKLLILNTLGSSADESEVAVWAIRPSYAVS